MSLVPHKIVALNELNEGAKNTIAGAVVSLFDTGGNAVTLFDDESGSNGSTAKQTDSEGVVVVYVSPGEYDEQVNGGIQRRVLVGNKELTTVQLIESMRNHREGDVITTTGFYEAGDGGGAQWRATGDTGLTPSQYPAELQAAELVSGKGRKLVIVPEATGAPTSKQLGAKADGVEDDTAAMQALTNYSVDTGNAVEYSSGDYNFSSISFDGEYHAFYNNATFNVTDGSGGKFPHPANSPVDAGLTKYKWSSVILNDEPASMFAFHTNVKDVGSHDRSKGFYGLRCSMFNECDEGDSGYLVGVTNFESKVVTKAGVRSPAQASYFYAGHQDNTARGNLIALECAVDGKGIDATFLEEDATYGITVNSASNAETVNTVGVFVKGGGQGWHYGYMVQDNKVDRAAFYYENHFIIDVDGNIGIGDTKEEPQAHIDIRNTSNVTTPTVRTFDSRGEPTGAIQDIVSRCFDDANVQISPTRIQSYLTDDTNGADSAQVRIGTRHMGVFSNRLRIGSGVYTEGATGGDKGEGTFNADAYHVGGTLWTSGSGSPEGVVTAPVGSLYSRTDGGAGSTLYVKESGTGDTGWVAK